MQKNKLLFCSLLILFTMQTARAQMTIPLYPDHIPGSLPDTAHEKSETVNDILIISNITRPTLTVYTPKGRSNGTAVIICPGGGYAVLAIKLEGTEIAEKFAEAGVTAFVLKYRLPDDRYMTHKETGPLQDAQQAIRLVRTQAARWNIDPAKIGIMGFSAGGHLAATAGTHYNTPVDTDSAHTSLRPDFMLLIYPVISFDDSIGHLGSRDNLLGKEPDNARKIAFSGERQVNTQTAPAFLVHASDDRSVNPENSIRFYQALLKNHVPAELHLFQEGGHGFGLVLKKEKEDWFGLCLHWMAAHGWD